MSAVPQTTLNFGMPALGHGHGCTWRWGWQELPRACGLQSQYGNTKNIQHVKDPTPTSEDIPYCDIVSSFNPTMPKSNAMLGWPHRNFKRDLPLNSIPSAGEPQFNNPYATHTLGSTSTPRKTKNLPYQARISIQNINSKANKRQCDYPERAPITVIAL